MAAKTFSAAAAIALLALAGALAAFGAWHGGPAMGGPMPFWNGTGNFTWPEPPSCGNGSWNEADRPMRPFWNSTFNYTKFEEARAGFEAAVLSGDYANAKSLHDSYGFGGGLFDRLNKTTFAQYSRIFSLRAQARNLENALGLELGLKGQPSGMPDAWGPQAFFGFGPCPAHALAPQPQHQGPKHPIMSGKVPAAPLRNPISART